MAIDTAYQLRYRRGKTGSGRSQSRLAEDQREYRSLQTKTDRIYLMGNTILTPSQHHFLRHVQTEEEILTWYYLTGGTALSEFYLHHRLSEDIDLFTVSQVNDRKIDEFLKKISPKLGITSMKKDQISGLFTYKLFFPNGETLKVDFNEYSYNLLESSMVKFGQLKIDSFYDISVNKAYSITGRFQVRDFIDLYFILKKKEFTLEQLIARIPDKFGPHIDHDYFAAQLLRVRDLPRAYPHMLVPFDFDEMTDYFTKEAKRIAEKHLFRK